MTHTACLPHLFSWWPHLSQDTKCESNKITVKCKNKCVGLFYTTATTNIHSTNSCNTLVTHEPQGMGTALPSQGRSLDNVRKTARVRNRYNQVPHLSQDTKWECNKITINITNKRQAVSLFLQGTTRQQWTDAKTWQTQDINNTNDPQIHKRSTALEWPEKILFWRA